MKFQKQCNLRCLLALVAVGAFVLQSQAIKNVAPSAPTVVVSVDIEKVFAALEERAAELSNVQALIDEMANDLEKRRQHIGNYEQEFELYQPGSEKWNELLQEQKLSPTQRSVQVPQLTCKPIEDRTKISNRRAPWLCRRPSANSVGQRATIFGRGSSLSPTRATRAPPAPLPTVHHAWSCLVFVGLRWSARVSREAAIFLDSLFILVETLQYCKSQRPGY